MSEPTYDGPERRSTTREDIERTLDEKVTALLEATAAQARDEGQQRTRRRWQKLLALLLTLVLGGLVSVQVQLLRDRAATRQENIIRCETRNRQSQALLDAITRGRNAPPPSYLTPAEVERQRKATDLFLQEFGPLPNCKAIGQ